MNTSINNSTTPFILIPLPSNISLQELNAFFQNKNDYASYLNYSKFYSSVDLDEKLLDELDDALLSLKETEKKGYNVTLSRIVFESLRTLVQELSPKSSGKYRGKSLKARNLLEKIFSDTPEFKLYRVNQSLLDFFYTTICKESSIILVKYWLDNPIRSTKELNKDIVAIFHSITQDCLSYRGRDKSYEIIKKVAYASKIVVPSYIYANAKNRGYI